MRFIASTLDDLCRKVLPKLLSGAQVTNSTRGRAYERRGVLLELRNPRARLSRTETRGKPFSSLGELLWYLSRDNQLDFIQYYIERYAEESEDGATVYGGYGRRLFSHPSHDQVRTLIENLKKHRDTRRAVLQIFQAEDTARRHKEVPCTLAMQFLLRKNKLDLMVTMRSQDAYIGLPHDIFCFTMLQEIIARSVNAEVGLYKEFVGSLHLYENARESAEQFLSEGFQQTIPMPPMPYGDPWPAIQLLLEAEERIRHDRSLPPKVHHLDPYWRDLIRLLEVFAATGNTTKIRRLKSAISFKGYCMYIDKRERMKPRKPQLPPQFRFPF
jgi:thymidylate synthase